MDLANVLKVLQEARRMLAASGPAAQELVAHLDVAIADVKRENDFLESGGL